MEENPLTKTWNLVHRAQGGDGDALDRLFARYYDRVRRSVRARVSDRLRARLEIEDILQPAFARAFQNFDRFEMRHEGSLLNWLAEYARRQIHDAVDRESAQKRQLPAAAVPIGPEDSTVGSVEPPDPSAAPIDKLAHSEHELLLKQCLDQLAPQYRDVIGLRDFDGLEWSEVARRLGKKTDSAAREQHRRALSELTSLLRRRGIGPELG